MAAGLLILGAAVMVRAQVPPTPLIPKGTHTLFGRVLDLGGDQPIAGAAVTIIGYFDASGKPVDGWPQSAYSPQASAPRAVLTTSDGTFVFRDLPAGRYTVAADAFGYMSDTYPPHLVEVQDRDAPTEMALRLWRSGAISGTVVDDRGEPVVGAQVTAFRCEVRNGGTTLRTGVQTADTDDRGMYRLAPLAPGRYVVAVLSSSLSMPAAIATAIDATASNRDESWALHTALLKGGGTSSIVPTGEGRRIGDFVLRRPGPPPVLAADGMFMTYATTMYPNAASPADATVITLGSGDVRAGIDVPLRLTPAFEVSGVVTGPDGPMNGLTLELRPPTGATTTVFKLEPTGSGSLLSYAEPLGIARAMSDASGAFRFLAISPGSYSLQAGYVVQGSLDSGDQGTQLWASLPVAVGDRSVTGLSVTMQTGAHLSGRAEFKGAGESPIASGLRVAVGLRPLGAGIWRSLQGIVRPDGTFTTPGDVPGRYLIFAFEPPGWTLESVSQGGRVVPDDLIDLGTSDVTGVVLTFTKTPPRVSGSIVDANGAADANTDVVTFPADTTLWREGVINSHRVRMAHATAAGAFELTGLSPGEYYVAAIRSRSTADWQDPAFLERVVPGATKVAIATGEHKVVALKTLILRGQ